MAQPVGRGLRPARHRGLTSPDPVRAPTARAATPNPRTPAQDLWTSRRTSQRQEKHAGNSSWRQTPATTALGIQPVDRG